MMIFMLEIPMCQVQATPHDWVCSLESCKEVAGSNPAGHVDFLVVCFELRLHGLVCHGISVRVFHTTLKPHV